MIISSKPNIPPTSPTWEIHIDGATYGGNPAPIGSAGLTVWMNGLLYHAETFQQIDSTNNSAEFFALLRALRWARCHDMTNVQVFTDSELVARWSRGEARIQNEKLKRIAAGCHHFRQYLDFTVTWVSRSEEKQAFTDYVAKLGLANAVEFKTAKQHRLLIGAYYDRA